jgi:hypothetical protein
VDSPLKKILHLHDDLENLFINSKRGVMQLLLSRLTSDARDVLRFVENAHERISSLQTQVNRLEGLLPDERRIANDPKPPDRPSDVPF